MIPVKQERSDQKNFPPAEKSVGVKIPVGEKIPRGKNEGGVWKLSH